MIPKGFIGKQEPTSADRNYVARKSRFVPRADRLYVATLSATLGKISPTVT